MAENTERVISPLHKEMQASIGNAIERLAAMEERWVAASNRQKEVVDRLMKERAMILNLIAMQKNPLPPLTVAIKKVMEGDYQ